jgi:hypothetical protein
VSPSQIAEIELPDVMRKVIGDPHGRALGFEFTPNVGDPVPCRIEARNDSGEHARLELIELRQIRGGTEELLLSNEQQRAAVTVQLSVKFTNHSVNVQFKSHSTGHNAALVAEWFRFQKVLSQPAVVVMQQIVTGIEFGRHRTNALFPAPDSELANIAEALSFIQRHTGALFAWPEMIPAVDQVQIDNVLDIMKSGRVSLESMSIDLVQDGVSKFVDDWKRNPPRTWHIPNYQITILGVPVTLGPVEVDCTDTQVDVSSQIGGEGEAVVIRPTTRQHLEAIFSRFPSPHSQAP